MINLGSNVILALSINNCYCRDDNYYDGVNMQTNPFKNWIFLPDGMASQINLIDWLILFT